LDTGQGSTLRIPIEEQEQDTARFLLNNYFVHSWCCRIQIEYKYLDSDQAEDNRGQIICVERSPIALIRSNTKICRRECYKQNKDVISNNIQNDKEPSYPW
jgi:hypothetical protein